MSERSPLDELCGEQLSAVTFVHDYLQLSFDGPTLTVTNPMTVSSATSRLSTGQAGFRDLLCAQIAKVVASVELREGEDLQIRFEDGSTIVVSLLADDYTSPEAIHAHGFKGGARLVV